MIKCPVCLSEFNDDAEQCASCGFKFSGATTSFKPINAPEGEQNRPTTDKISSPKRNTPCLRVIKGPQGELVLPLSKEKMTIGRSPNSDIFLNDRTVSREHALIVVNNDVVQIADCNSFNGLWVNNQNVVTANLKEGDLIQIGIFFLRFEN